VSCELAIGVPAMVRSVLASLTNEAAGSDDDEAAALGPCEPGSGDGEPWLVQAATTVTAAASTTALRR